VRFRPTAIIWFIVSAPFLTLLLLASGSLWGLFVLFVSHVIVLVVAFIPTLQGFGPVVTRYTTSTRTAWLTIDDGPDPSTTPKVLTLLKAFGARATFFLIGAKAAQHPELTRMILEAGHTIGNHTQTHPQFKFWRLDPKTLAKEIDEFEATVSSLNAPVPLWFRAPAGLKNPFLHPILAARGLHLIGWNARAFDTQLGDCARIVHRIMQSLKPGSIILFHESQQPKVCLEALESLLSTLRDEQFELILPQPHDLIAGRRWAVDIGSVSCSALRWSAWSGEGNRLNLRPSERQFQDNGSVLCRTCRSFARSARCHRRSSASRSKSGSASHEVKRRV
jgi:peptidoglycan-N-acetylglucosamine deacetylase